MYRTKTKYQQINGTVKDPNNLPYTDLTENKMCLYVYFSVTIEYIHYTVLAFGIRFPL